MKAILILIVSVGTSQASLDLGASSLEVRQIEFSNLAACERAAEKLSRAGRTGSDWAKTFAINTAKVTGNEPFLALPSVIAECVEL